MSAFCDWSAPSAGQSLAAWQAGRCAMCGITPDALRKERLNLDHDHETGLTRGYLCSRCNRMEATSTLPVWTAWRAGSNPAATHGLTEVYVNMWGDTPIWDTAVDENELRAAIHRLSA